MAQKLKQSEKKRKSYLNNNGIQSVENGLYCFKKINNTNNF